MEQGLPAPPDRAVADTTRGQLDDLLAAVDAELRRRGVGPPDALPAEAPPGGPSAVPAPVPAADPGAGRGRPVAGGVAEPRPAGFPAGGPTSNGHRRRPALRDLVDALPPLPGRERLAAELPAAALTAGGRLALWLREVTGRDLLDLESMQELISFAYRLMEVRRTHRGGKYPVDEFGFDPEWTEALLPLASLVYRRYWRVDTVGIGNLPRRGGALLVSNHSGVLPLDGAMIKVAAFEEGLNRHIRALIATFFFGLPGLSWFLRRTGQTVGHPDDTLRLLGCGELVLVFPEGVKGTGKPFSERYRLRRFGRGGFAEVAIRAGVPIIPISVVGAEEIYPMLADIRPLAELSGFPYFPITPTWPWLGPLGLIPLPTKWRIEFHPPVRTDQLPAGAADDVATVMRMSDTVRDVIQQGLISNLMERRGVFRG